MKIEMSAQAHDVTNDILVILSKEARRLDELKEIEGVESVGAKDPKRLLLRMNIKADADKIIHKAVLKLIEQGGQIRSISPASQSLDEVYLKYIQGDER